MEPAGIVVELCLPAKQSEEEGVLLGSSGSTGHPNDLGGSITWGQLT